MWSKPATPSSFGNLFHCPWFLQSGSTNPHKNALLETELRKLLKKGAIEVLPDKSSLRFYSRLFLVPKPSNKWRPIIDLSHLNDFVQIPKFKMDTPQNVMSSLKKDCWVYSLELKDAYLQVPIHQRSRKYHWMELQGTIYQSTSLPFGISTAPWLFTRIAGVVKELFHKEGLSLF